MVQLGLIWLKKKLLRLSIIGGVVKQNNLLSTYIPSAKNGEKKSKNF